MEALPAGYCTIPEFSDIMGISENTVHNGIRKKVITAFLKLGTTTALIYAIARTEYLTKTKFSSKDRVAWAAAELLKTPIELNAWREKNKSRIEEDPEEEARKEREELLKEILPGVQNSLVSKAKKDSFDARKAELEVGELEGKLISKQKVEKDAADVAQVLKSFLANIPPRISSQLSVETDKDKIEKIIEDELQTALIELCAKMNKQLNGEDILEDE